jgi:hypothetical protein
MPLSHGASAKQARDVDQNTPLPLAQQILAWLIQALGYEHQRKGSAKLSSSTLKHARRGKMIRPSWKALVEEACRLLHLSTPAPEVLSGMLREWDGYVSTLRSPTLDVGDRLLPMMQLAAPRLGVRLGAAMALACVMTGKPTTDWEWLCDPLAPEVFRKVLRLMLAMYRPEWKTWTGRNKERGRIRGVDSKTIRRWDDGAVPGPQNISAIVEDVGESSEAPLRWARAAMVARTDLEGWVGKDAVDSWREAVRHTAKRIGRELATDPRAVPRIAELWSESLVDAPDLKLAEQLASLVRVADIPITAETVESWLRGVATRPAAASPSFNRDARAMLLLSVVLPHAWLVAATFTHLDLANALVVAGADHQLLLACEWDWRSLLRDVEGGTPVRRQYLGGPEETVPITEAARSAARLLLSEGSRFLRSANSDHEARMEAAMQTVCVDVLGRSLAQYAQASETTAVAYAVLNRHGERHLPDDVVRGVPKFALARTRRLATDGDVPGAIALIDTLDLSSYEPDTQEREDLATFLSELAHWVLDEVYGCLRSSLAELASAGVVGRATSHQALELILGEVIDRGLANADRSIEVAIQWLAPRQVASSPVEVVVLSFPYHVRRERLLMALGRPVLGVSHVRALVESMIEYAARPASDGAVYAMLALWRRLGGAGSAWVPEDVDPRCEHLGTSALRDRWLARIQNDLASP